MNDSVNMVRTTIELKRGRNLIIGEEKRTNRIEEELLCKCVASSEKTICILKESVEGEDFKNNLFYIDKNANKKRFFQFYV
jgi:hypothetical protein